MLPWWKTLKRKLSGKATDKALPLAVLQLQQESVANHALPSCAGTDEIAGSKAGAGADSKTTLVEETKCSTLAEDAVESSLDFVQTTVQTYPYGHLQMGLLSESTSLASTALHSHVSQDPGLFSRKPPQEELLPRMMGGVEPISEMDVTVEAEGGTLEPQPNQHQPRNGRAVREEVLTREPASEKPGFKLTAATLGTHAALTDGLRSAQRTSRKNNFIKSWLMDAELVSDSTGTTAPTSISPSPRTSQPQHANVVDALLHAEGSATRSAAPTVHHNLKPSSSQMSALLELPAGTTPASNAAAEGAVATALATPGATVPPTSSSTTTLTSPVAAMLAGGGGGGAVAAPRVAHPTLVPAAPSPSPSPMPLPSPETRMMNGGGELHLHAIPPTPPALPTAAGPPLTATATAAPVSAAASLTEPQGSAHTVSRPLSKQPSIPEHQLQSEVAVLGGDVSMYIPSTVTTMTTASQAEARESIPARMVDANSSQGPAREPRPLRVLDGGATAMRLPQAAPPERTKTIAVASHCPEDMYAQQWSIDDFVLLRKLYEGSLSVVCHAQHRRSGRHVALKVYKRSRLHEMERFQLAREICLHIRILHPYILALFAAWKDSKYVYLVLEWAPRGNLFDFLVARGGRLEEGEAAAVVLRPLMAALAFLHSQAFIHRDIKLENIVLDAQCQIKLCDFGLAIDQKFEQANTRLGTFGYFAPELLNCPLKKGPFDFKGDPSVPTYDCKVDCWSAGVLAYELLTGKAPFSASSAPKILDAIKTRELEYPSHLSEGAVAFLRAALTRDPTQRSTAKQLMTHPWVAAACATYQGGSPLPSFAPIPTPAPAPPPVVPVAPAAAAGEQGAASGESGRA